MLYRPLLIACCVYSVVLSMSVVALAEPPAAVLSIRSIDSLLEDAKFLDDETGEDYFKWSVDNLIKVFTKQQGLAGVDRAKGLGAYWNFSATRIEEPVIFVPVADVKTLKDQLAKAATTFEVEDGAWRMTFGGNTLFAKVDRGYCFISPDVTLPPDLADPAKIINTQYDLAFDVTFPSINPTFAAAIVKAVEVTRIAPEKGAPASSDSAVARELGQDAALTIVKALANDGDRLTLGVDLNQKTRLGVVELLLTGKPASGLAAAMTSITRTTPLFAEIGPKDSAARLVFSLPTAGMADPLARTIRAMGEQSMQSVDLILRDESELNKANEKQLLKSVLKIIEAAMQEEYIHVGVALRANADGTVCVVGGAHVASGEELNRLVDEVAAMPADKTKPAGKIDVAKHAGARIHAAPPNPLTASVKLYGGGPPHIANRGDRVWLSFGKDNLDVLRGELDKSATKASHVASPISVQVKPAQLIAAFEKNEQVLIKRAKAIAGQPSDKLNLMVVPSPNGAKVRVELSLDLLNLDPRKAE